PHQLPLLPSPCQTQIRFLLLEGFELILLPPKPFSTLHSSPSKAFCPSSLKDKVYRIFCREKRKLAGRKGVYVENQCSDKITQLTDNVYVCRSGSAADSQVVSDYVRHFLHQHTVQLWQPATVKVVANLIKLLSYGNKNMLQTGLIVGGWDKYEGGKIYGVPLGGTVIKVPFAIGGSGSSYLYGFFDQAWREGMTKDEAEGETLKVLKALEAVVSHLRKFLVDHSVLPLFEKTYTAPVSQERQPDPWADKSLLHTATQP
ncbi:proteasome subunit beta type-6-like, partial [Rosa rugosa]